MPRKKSLFGNRMWTPQDDVDQVNARNFEVDPVQDNQTLLNQLDTDNNFAASRGPQWSRYFALLDAKGANVPQTAPESLDDREAELAQFGQQSRKDFKRGPAVSGLRSILGR